LNEKDRESTWKEAAGEGKSLARHVKARFMFIRTANEESAEAKKGVGLTTEDIEALEKKRIRLSKTQGYNRAYRKTPGTQAKTSVYNRTRYQLPDVRKKDKANARARLDKPGNRKKKNASSIAYNKAKREALQVERVVESKANGDRTTDFGLGDVSHEDEIKCGACNIMDNPAGVLHPKGEATTANWIQDHGSKSIEEVLATREWAAYFLITKQSITSGKEIKCPESTAFMSQFERDPLWRIDTVDNEEQHDFRRFTPPEARKVVHSYLLAKCISAYDASGLERALQGYIEDMGMPHGMCLHQKVGAGFRVEYGKTKPETTFVALSLIRVKSPFFADVDPVDPNRNPPLISCTVTSHDGKIDYNVAVRGDKQKFQGTKSVLEDEAMNKAAQLQRNMRHKKRKADAISTSDDDKSSE